jgi:hypothetical protein
VAEAEPGMIKGVLAVMAVGGGGEADKGGFDKGGGDRGRVRVPGQAIRGGERQGPRERDSSIGQGADGAEGGIDEAG